VPISVEYAIRSLRKLLCSVNQLSAVEANDGFESGIV